MATIKLEAPVRNIFLVFVTAITSSLLLTPQNLYMWVYGQFLSFKTMPLPRFVSRIKNMRLINITLHDECF